MKVFSQVKEAEESIIPKGRRNPKHQMEWLMKSGNMRGKYLGACLDSCRWGAATTVMWETNVYGLMNLIDNWRKQNNDKESLYHELTIEEMWKRFELPYIDHKSCPRGEKHTGTFLDRTGIVKCSHIEKIKMKPSFLITDEPSFDKFSRLERISFY